MINPKCKDCVYFEEQWDFNFDAGCNRNPCITTLTYPDDEACSTYEPKNNENCTCLGLFLNFFFILYLFGLVF